MMRPVLGIAALAAVSFFWFPGHTILQSDTQIYIPILERLHDPSLYSRDIMAVRPHVSFTLYDEVVRSLHRVTGAGFEPILLVQQFVYRALGMLGLWLLATGVGLGGWQALAVTAIVSLGAVVNGPQVLTIEYEPVPRGFSLSFVLLSLGCAGRGWWKRSGSAAGLAWAWHPPTAMAYCLLLAGVLIWRRKWRALALIGICPALVFLTLFERQGNDRLPLFATIDPPLEAIQRMRASYNWISMWWRQWWPHYTLLLTVVTVAVARLWRGLSGDMRVFFAGMPVMGVLGVPASLIMLEGLKWTLIAQYQPGRYLMYVTLIAAIACSIAALREQRFALRAAFLVVPFALPLSPDLTALSGVPLLLTAGLAVTGALPRMALASGALAFLLLPTVGQVVNFPHVHSRELNELAQWARNSTPKDALFQFADVRRGLQPGIFRARAQRAIYADWKAGGQVNFLRSFAQEWAERWKTVERAKPLAVYGSLGIDYVVYSSGKAPRGVEPVYANAQWVVIAPARNEAR